MDAEELLARSRAMTAWTQTEDPLLGAMPDPVLDEHAVATLVASSGRAAAVARVAHAPLSESRSLWTPSTADVLQPRLAADATADDVADLLDAWLARGPAPVAERDGDHAWVLRLPVVARLAVLPLLERGFAPATHTMVRPVRAADAAPEVASGGMRIRSAMPADEASLVALMRELVTTEVAFGATRARRRGIGDHYAADAIGFGEGWSQVAEIDGEVVGWMSLSPVEDSGWAAPSTSLEPIAYLGIASVGRARRSGGIGRALAAAVHAHARAQAVSATLLDASAQNPWSIPFWHRVGYRPLWTTWQRRIR